MSITYYNINLDKVVLKLKQILMRDNRIKIAIRVPVDLIPLDEAPPKLQYKILMHGSPIIVRNKDLYNRLFSFAFGQLQDIQLKLANS